MSSDIENKVIHRIFSGAGVGPPGVHGLDVNKQGLWINQLTTHLPDEVFYADHSKEMPFQNRFQGVVMFLDISGFTALCERYAMNSKNGTDQLTKTLNGYMSALVGAILDSDGDILKFAGDAILTFWKVSNFHHMKVTLPHVIRCAVRIQEEYGEWTTSVGVKLRVKIGLAAGEMGITFLGNNELCHYVSQGRAIEAVNLAEHHCKSGDVVISPTAWCHCSELDCTYELLSDNKHVKILSFEDPEADEEPFQSVNFMTLTDTMNTANKERESMENARDLQHETSTPDKQFLISNATGIAKSQRMRKAIVHVLEPHEELKRKLYICKPVLKKIEEKQPLEYLSEMRQVTVVFMNLVLQESTKMENAIIMQETFNIIYSNVKKGQGCLSKMFTFDKGSTFLVIFGLPGFKHENDCAHALKCSHVMKQELDSMKEVECTSIGVTTGPTFCGVVGHPHRHEYTVIGRKVNMAARLMMHYPNKVTCDTETFHHSKISKGNFHMVELKEMKGLSNVGTIREYSPSSGENTADVVIQHETDYPIIGRDKELRVFINEIKEILSMTKYKVQKQIISFEGEPGIGKTKMIDAVSVIALKVGMKVISCSLTMHDAKSPFYTVKSLLMDLLGFTFDMCHQERENTLLQMFTDKIILDNLDLLNDIFNVQFEVNNQKLSYCDESQRESLQHSVIFSIIKEMTQKYGLVIFTIDDAHFMDEDSWKFISALCEDDQSLCILSLRMPFTMCETAENILQQPSIVHVQLSGLEPQYLAALACQLLGVCRIPVQLEGILQDKSHGVPSWCEQLLREMIRDGSIRIDSLQSHHDAPMIMPMQKGKFICSVGVEEIQEQLDNTSGMKIKKTLDEALPAMSYHRSRAVEMHSMLICIIGDESLLKVGLPNSIKGMIQARIDRMEIFDQMIVKTASILGLSFPRQILEKIVPTKMTRRQFGQCLQRLTDNGIFQCGYPFISWKVTAAARETLTKSTLCICPAENGTEVEKPMDECKFVRFKSGSMQETAYEMFLQNTRRKLHINAAKFLEAQVHKCGSCGGGNFIQTILVQQNEMERQGKKTEVEKQVHFGGIGLFRGATPLAVKPNQVDVTSSPRDSLSSEHSDDDIGRLTTMELATKERRKSRRVSIADAIHRRLEHQSTKSFNLKNRAGSEFAAKTEKCVMEDAIDGVDNLAKINIDRRECQCVKVIMSLYPQLIRHWRAAGNVSKTVHYLLESGAAAISLHDNQQAVSYLREAQHFMEETAKGNNPFQEVDVQEYHCFSEYDQSHLHSLMGQSFFHMGRVEESVVHFNKALSILSYDQPHTKSQYHMTLVKNIFKQMKHLLFQDRYIGRNNSLVVIRYKEVTRSLSHLVHWHLVNKKDMEAFTIVLQQINCAEEINADFSELIMAYCCMMECCLVFFWRKVGQMYDRKASGRCALAMQSIVDVDCLIAISHYHVASLDMKLTWAMIDEAIESGYMALGLIQKMHDNDMKIRMVPTLAQALILANRVVDAVDVLKELMYTQEETSDQAACIFYYASCMDLILETGYQLETHKKCVKMKSEISGLSRTQVGQMTEFYFMVNMALWHMRKLELKQLEQCMDVVKKLMPHNCDSFLGVRGLLKTLEISLIKLSLSFSKFRLKAPMDKLKEAINKEFHLVEDICSKMPVFAPRIFHLKAYYHAVSGNHGLAKKFLKKAMSKAAKTGCCLEVEWARHNQCGWFDEDSEKGQTGFWRERSTHGMLDYHMASEGNKVLYTLPLPSWFTR